MKTLKAILFIIAGFSLIFGFLSFLGAGANADLLKWGFILSGLGIILVIIALQFKPKAEETTNVTVNIDLPGEVGMDTIKCKSCGGALSEKDVKLVAGAPVVTCPFCGTTYQLTEEPKW